MPYLAKDLPKVSADGKTYSLTLKDGLKYSDGTPIKASDFAATIERDFKVDSPGVGFFGNIVGADTFAKTKTGHISGITTDDKTGDDHDQAERAAGRLLEHPRHRVRGARARERAGQGSVDDAAALLGPVHDQELRPEQEGDRRSQPELRRGGLRRQRSGRATRT